MITKEFVVIDLDGTLCNSAHREHFAKNKDWEEFHSLLHEDRVNEDVRQAMESFSFFGMKLIILTGRPEKYRKATNDWLDKNNLSNYVTAILMRSNDDYRSDGDMKADWLARFFGGLEEALRNVLFILDDRDSVVEDLRNKGFRCWQVQVGGY